MAQYHNQISRLSKEIIELQKDDAREAKKAVRLQEKAGRAQQVMSRSSNSSVIQSKWREIERATKDLASINNKRAKFAARISEKHERLRSYQEKQSREDEKARKVMADLEKELRRDREAYRKQVDEMIQLSAQAPIHLDTDTQEKEIYDFFISYASQDKKGLVHELAGRLQEKGARVWYDNFVLKVGDSLRRKIDQGLANSLFGVVVVSKNFFGKEWAQKELDGLMSREADGVSRIFPIWHKISRDDIARSSPMLLDRVGLSTSEYTVEEIAEMLLEAKKLRQKRRSSASSS